ncbi:phosphoribosylanthranilate isomerase [Microvirga massiliensis]|uniref:phosphoribosylanthranilate isomerase n=1 Tax=Microvirga massiliensis TaxID=1033741 RepID=UPI00062BA58C|nr:phosphoribosylanthranilate isomerase [Microvirga massiliensis]
MDGFVKICGLSTADALSAALEAGADMVGFVRFARSPRHIPLDIGHALSAAAAGRAQRVLLMVDPSDAELDEAVGAIGPDWVQLHGRESPERVAAIRARGRPVLKAVGIAGPEDIAWAQTYRAVADALLLDAKSPPGGLPGGNGLAFDWRLLAGLDPAMKFMLSGGLDAGSVGEAIALTGARAVDVSSGVEARPGVKDPERIRAFVRAARAALSANQTRAGRT